MLRRKNFLFTKINKWGSKFQKYDKKILCNNNNNKTLRNNESINFQTDVAMSFEYLSFSNDKLTRNKDDLLRV